MSSETRILFSEGQPYLVHFDNGLIVHTPIEIEDTENLLRIIKGERVREGTINIKREDYGEKGEFFLQIAIQGENTNIEIGISHRNTLKLLIDLER